MLKKLRLLLPLALLVIAACQPTLASAPPEITKQETTPAQVATPTPTPKVGASVDVDPRNWPKMDNKPPVMLPPFRDKPAATLEEELAWRKEMIDKGLISNAPPAYGPHRKGDFVIIKGIKIKLPDDTYNDGFVAGVDVPMGKPQPETPYYIIVRGNSRILVTVHTGKILREIIAPGEENTFDFLKRALQ